MERFPELSLFYGLSSPLDSEMICIFPYFCPCEESAREIREILCQSMQEKLPMASFVVRKDEMWVMTDYEEKGRKS